MSSDEKQSREEKQAEAQANGQSVLQKAAYLDVTYSASVAPASTYPEKLGKWLIDNVFGSSGRILDMGCGRGDFLDVFAALDLEVAGLDISPRAVELAQEHDVRVADLETEALPFPPNSFDFVFSKSVVEHMRAPSRLVEAASTALRPGGTAVVMTPSWAHTYWGPFYIDHTHVTPFTAPSLADLFAFAGFNSVKVMHFYQLPFVWRHPVLKMVPRFIAMLPLPHRPFSSAPWPDGLNKLIRFSKEVMLLGIGVKGENSDKPGKSDT